VGSGDLFQVAATGAVIAAPAAQTVASAPAAEFTTLTVTPPTITLTGGTAVTSPMESVIVSGPTITDGSAVTVTRAATMSVGEPTAAGSVTITDKFALDVTGRVAIAGDGTAADPALRFGTEANGVGIWKDAATSLSMGVSGVERMRINTAVSIFNAYLDVDHATGITTPQATIGLFNTNATTINFAGAATSLIAGATTGNTTIRNATLTLSNGNYTTCTALTTAAGVVTCTVSDERLKDVMGAPEGIALDAVDSIHPTRFAMTPGTRWSDDREHLGFLAQDVEGPIPWAVYEGGAELDDGSKVKSVDTTAILAMAVLSIKELRAQVDAQQKMIAAIHEAAQAGAVAQNDDIRSLYRQVAILQATCSHPAAPGFTPGGSTTGSPVTGW
jgi:hypothetical protein